MAVKLVDPVAPPVELDELVFRGDDEIDIAVRMIVMQLRSGHRPEARTTVGWVQATDQ